MGQLYSKMYQLLWNDVATAADPDRPREKLTTPARGFQIRLPDPRSATQFIDRTPILANPSAHSNTPKAATKSAIRPRYLETDLDEVIPQTADERQTTVVKRLCPSSLATSTPVHSKKSPSDETVEDVIDSIIGEAIDQVTEMRFSDTGVCEVVTSERSSSTASPLNRAMQMSSTIGQDSGRISFAEEVKCSESQELSSAEVIVQSEEVQQISCVDDVVKVILEEGSESLVANWSGVGGPDHSIGTDVEVAMENFLGDSSQPEISVIIQEWDSVELTAEIQESEGDEEDVEQEFCYHPSDSMVVHNDSDSFAEPTSDFEWDNDYDSLLISSPPITRPDTENTNKKNAYITPKKTALISKPSGRTPLGDVSTNSPVIQHNLTPKQSMTPKNQNLFLSAVDKKVWKNIKDERIKRCCDAENTPPQAPFNSYPPEVVQSAPGKIRTKKTNTKWSNDSLLI